MATSPDQISETLTVQRIAQILTCHGDPGCSDPAYSSPGRWLEVIDEAITAGELKLVEKEGENETVNKERERRQVKGLWRDNRKLRLGDVRAWLKKMNVEDADIPDFFRPIDEVKERQKQEDNLHPKRENTYLKTLAALLALQYGLQDLDEPFKLAEEFLDDCDKKGIAHPAGRSTLGELFKQLPSVQNANPD